MVPIKNALFGPEISVFGPKSDFCHMTPILVIGSRRDGLFPIFFYFTFASYGRFHLKKTVNARAGKFKHKMLTMLTMVTMFDYIVIVKNVEAF